MMQKLMEIRDELVRVLAERDELRKDQTKLQGICADGGRRIAELQSERDTARRESIQWASDCIALQSELDTAKEHAGRLQAELDRTRKQLQDVCSAQSVRSAGQSDLVRDVSHYTEAAEVDRPIEPQPQPVQVREGRWRTRGGKIRNVTPTPEDDERAMKYPWYDARYGKTWLSNGQYYSDRESHRDLVEYLGPIEPQPEPVQVPEPGKVEEQVGPEPRPEPRKVPRKVQVREGRWRKRSGGEVSVSAMPTDHDGFTAEFPWWDGKKTTWTQQGRLLPSYVCPADLVEYLGPVEPQPKPEKVEEQVPQPVQVREGRWLTRGGEVRNVTRTPDENELRDQFPWWDANTRNTWREDGRYVRERENVRDLVQYLGPIESRPKSQSGPWDVLRRLWLGIYAGGSDV